MRDFVLITLALFMAATQQEVNGQNQPGEGGNGSGSKTVDPMDPVLNFEHVWRTIDRNYGQFAVKQVDWDAIYRVYRPQVSTTTTNEELWDILLAMLGHLNDEHVCLADGSRRIGAGSSDERKPDDYSLDLVKTTYLHGKFSDALGGSFVYGWLSDGMGYLYIADLKDPPDAVSKTIDAVMAEFAMARVMIVDVRNNPGGNKHADEIVANRFADRERHYMTVQTRYGPAHDDLWPAEYRCIEPSGPVQFTRPTVLLANRASASAADILILAMRVLPHVTVAGDTSEGALSGQFPEPLPNGWTLWVAFKLLRDHHGVCWDGVGIPPDLRVCNTAADLAAGRDRVLEFAMQFLETGAPAPQDETASLANLKTSLVEEYVHCVSEQGLEAAVTQLNQGRADSGGAHYFSPEQALQQATQYLGREQYAEAIGLLRACREDFPKLAHTYATLAQAYLGQDDVAAAEAVLKEGETVEAMFTWELPQIERAKKALRKAQVGSAAVLFGKALSEGGIPAAEKQLKDLLERRPEGPVFDENDFNALGYQLLGARQIESAVFVMEKTVALFPDSWNAWDSLGEVAAKAGLKEIAIAGYRRSLELNPQNKSGRAILEQLEKGN